MKNINYFNDELYTGFYKKKLKGNLNNRYAFKIFKGKWLVSSIAKNIKWRKIKRIL